MDEEEIKPIEPKGLSEYPRTPLEIPSLAPKNMPEERSGVDDSVSSLAIILLWIKESIISSILANKEGRTMETTKIWYLSKTLWVNILTVIWYFLGPVIGIPVLSSELTVAFLAGVNFFLRMITKKEVTFQ